MCPFATRGGEAALVGPARSRARHRVSRPSSAHFCDAKSLLRAHSMDAGVARGVHAKVARTRVHATLRFDAWLRNATVVCQLKLLTSSRLAPLIWSRVAIHARVDNSPSLR